MINQNPLISEQLSLWDQHGSRVVRGNLIVIPIENSFLYVEPVYLTAEENNIPQLKRVIAISGDRVVMEASLEEAVQSVFGLKQGGKTTVADPGRDRGHRRGQDGLCAGRKSHAAGEMGRLRESYGSLETSLIPSHARPERKMSIRTTGSTSNVQRGDANES